MGRGIERAVRDLRQIADQFAEWQRPTFAPPATQRDVASLESAAHIEVPPAFRDFLFLADSVIAMEVANGYWIGGTRELTRSLKRRDYPELIEVHGALERVVPVCTDGGGNLFMACVDSGPVYRVDHESAAIATVAADFTDFLRRCLEDWTHALENDSSWTYLT